MRLIRRLRQDERGASALEFVLVAPALVLMIVGIARLGILFMSNAGLNNAVAEGARYATIFPRPSDTQIQGVVTGSQFGLYSGLSAPTVAHGVVDGTNYVDITGSYAVPMDFIFFNFGNVNLSVTRRAFVHALPPSTPPATPPPGPAPSPSPSPSPTPTPTPEPSPSPSEPVTAEP